MPFCPYTILSIPFCPYHFVRYHFVRSPVALFRDRDGKYYVNFWTGTRLPVQNLDGYPGSFLSKICSPISNLFVKDSCFICILCCELVWWAFLAFRRI